MKIEPGIPSAPAYPTSHLKYLHAQEGDTLRTMSERTGVTVEELGKHNHKVKDPDAALAKGTTIVVPEHKEAAPKHDAPRKADGTLVERDKAIYVDPKVKAAEAEHAHAAAKTGPPAHTDHADSPVSSQHAHEAPPAPPPPDSGSGSASADAALVKAQIKRMGQESQVDPEKPLAAKAEAGATTLVEESKKVSGTRDILDTTKDTLKATEAQMKSLRGLAETKVGGLTVRLEKYGKEAAACMHEIAAGASPQRVAQLQEKMEGLWKASASTRAELGAAAKELASLEKQTVVAAKTAGMAEGMSEVLAKTKKIGHGAFLAMAPLEAMAMYMDFEKSNPGHPAQNLVKAATAFSGKFALDMATSGTKLNIAETAVGALKFGMEMMGLKDTPPYDAVDVISQAFPLDAVAKGLGAGVDLAAASYDYMRGDGAKMDKLFEDNMHGKNGQVLQGLQVLSDLMMTGGQNIPQDAESIKFSQMFWNDGHTEVSSSQTGRTGKEKLRLLDQLMEGGQTAPNDVIKIQQILARSTPKQLDEIFLKKNGLELARSLPPASQSKDPAVSTFLDMARIAGTAHSGQPDAPVWRDLDMFLSGLDIEKRKGALDELRQHVDAGHLKQIPGWLQQRIRWQYGQ